MKHKLALCAVLLISFCSGCRAQEIPLREAEATKPALKYALAKAYNATVEIYAQLTQDGDFCSLGTGWLAKDQHTVITAKHVTHGFEAGGFGTLPWKQLKLHLSNGDWVEIKMTQVKESAQYDMSVITLTKELDKQFKPLQFAKDIPQLGDGICGVGFPLNYNQIAFDGHLTGVYVTSSPYWLTNAVINPGHSGSAVLNYDGNVVGMILAKDRRTESINYILPYPIIVKELETK